MASVSTYLNFMGDTEAAFSLYGRAFGSTMRGLQRMGEIPDGPELSDEEKMKVMHVELDILGGHTLMATDMLESMGHQLRIGNNVTVSLQFYSREQADATYAILSENSTEATGMSEMFWGYWGVCLDQFGVRWMFNVSS